jgi:hypothetical protein
MFCLLKVRSAAPIFLSLAFHGRRSGFFNFHPIILIDPSSMGNEDSNECAPRSPLCPSCAQIMRLARITSRFGDLPHNFIFECRTCGLSLLDTIVAAGTDGGASETKDSLLLRSAVWSPNASYALTSLIEWRITGATENALN